MFWKVVFGMVILNKRECLKKKNIIKEIKEGKTFIYPTDTIYGIGCNAKDSEAVQKIRRIKSRDSKPFSVIAPSIQWIRKNLVVNKNAEKWLRELPGPYTLILKLKTKKAIAGEVNDFSGTLGVRMPDNWFSELVTKAGVPFVTTSVNPTGQPHMTSLNSLDKAIKNEVDYIIYEGQKKGKASKVVDVTSKFEEILRS